MKRLYIFLLMFLLLGTAAFAEVTTDDLDANQVIYLSGSAELNWGFGGQVIDNTTGFLGEISNRGLLAGTDSDVGWPSSWTLGLEAADADGTVIVAAEAEIDLNATLILQDDEGVSFEFIEFPNVIPGMLAIRLLPDDVVGTDVTASDSASSAPTVELVATPMEGLEAKLSVAFANGQFDSKYWPTNPAGAGVDFSVLDSYAATVGDLYDVLDTATVDGDEETWALDNYSSFGVALQLEYELAIGDEDTVTVTAGTVFDTAYTNHVYAGALKQSDIALAPGDRWYITETWGAKVSKNWDIWDDAAAAYDGVAIVDMAYDMLRGNVWGYATLPIGLQLDLDMMGIEASLAFQARMVDGWDVANPSEGTYDIAVAAGGDPLDPFDPASYATAAEYAVGAPRAYAMPMYISVDAAYEMEMGDMTIAPSADFKMSTDFYKIGPNDDGDEIEYKGDVTAAQFLGRQMSAGAGVDVSGIAGMVDISLSGAIGFGFGSEAYLWPFDGNYNAVTWPGDIQNELDDQNYSTTEAEKALALLSAEPDSGNNMIFIDDFSVYSASVGIEAETIANLKLSNDFSYTHDGMGIEGANDVGVVSMIDDGVWLDIIENATGIEYDIQVADSTAAILYADLTFTKLNYSIEQGTYFEGWNVDATDLDDLTVRIWDSETSTKTTFEYEVGVKVTVDL